MSRHVKIMPDIRIDKERMEKIADENRPLGRQ